MFKIILSIEKDYIDLLNKVTVKESKKVYIKKTLKVRRTSEKHYLTN